MPKLISALLLLLICPRFAQSADCEGKVTNATSAGISGIVIEIKPGKETVRSGANGEFRLTGLAPGTYQLTATGRGYVPFQESLEVPAGCANLAIRLSTVQTAIEVSEPSDSFLATASVSITKSPASLIDTPYAIQMIPQALLESRNIQDIKDLYRNISGVTDSPYSAMTFRGFTQREVLFNGVRGNPYGSLDNDINDAGFSTSQGRLSNIEFVEVLKGPAGVLFGGGEAGGIINFVTRKPRQTPAAEASFRTGSFAQRAGHGEITGPLWKAKNLFYRAAIFAEERRVFRYNAGNENLHLASGLSWRLAEATSLGFEYEYIDQNLLAHRLRGIPVNSTGGWLAAREWTASEQGDSSQLQARVFQSRLDHAFTSTLRSDVTFRFLNYDRPERYHEPRGINPDGRTMRREFRDQFRGNQDYSLTANGYQRVARNNLTFGFEAVRQDWVGRYGTARETSRGGPVPPLDLLTPVYGLPANYFISPASYVQQNVVANRQGYFLQDQIEITPRFQVMLGGRVERFTDTGSAAGIPLRAQVAALTGRAGAVYRLLPKLSAFASISNSFNRAPSLAQTPLANGPHDPERGRQVEAGVKSELQQGRILMTASWFRIDKRNVLRLDPAFGPRGDNFSAVFPIGQVRNQGLELDATGRITRDLSIIVNYAFLDSDILADRFTPSAVGKALPNAARHAGGLFLRYDWRRTGSSFHAGSEMRGRRYEPYAAFPAAGYGLWDFAFFQRLGKKLELRVQLDNAFDKLYAASSLFAARAGNLPGAPRTFTMGLHFRSPRTP
ncbi:MAG: TonB-dependent receptor [Bryobacteraceae bacterium]|nr:TonB-dependent receptor [Bryobacteraceae bacterium]